MLTAPRTSGAGSALPDGLVEGTRTVGLSQDVERDDLSRQVHGLLGLPIDVVDFASLIRSIDSAARHPIPLLVSTPNVNFLVKSLTNGEFRETILSSDLCLADGMPLIWIAKLLRVPIHERVAGADLFAKLKLVRAGRRIKVFLLGGAPGLAERVCHKLNSAAFGLECVGALNPGFGTIEEMSGDQVIETINSSGADLLAVFFNAEKAQQWLIHNHRRLRPPVRAQFGATINFEAGVVKRAPTFLRNTGFEWLWRIKEEPHLWSRYWSDGKTLLRLLVTCVVPLAIAARRSKAKSNFLTVHREEAPMSVILRLSGSAISDHVDLAIGHFRAALAAQKHVEVYLSETSAIDARFFGLLLMLRKALGARGKRLTISEVPPRLRQAFQLNRFEYLLES